MQCVLEERICTKCGKCNLCDLNSSKVCDNCMACLDKDERAYATIPIMGILDNEDDAAAYTVPEETNGDDLS